MLRGGTTSRAEGDAGTVAELAGLLREHFAAPATTSWGGLRADPPPRLVYLLDHEYTPRTLNWTRMKGADARRVPLLREAAEAAGYEAILGLADVKTTHDAWPANEGHGCRRRRYYDGHEDPEDSAGYEINDLINTEVSLTHWTGPDGGRLEETSLSVDDTETCASTPAGDLEPYESGYEGYMGNWGNTLDRWYHRGAVIVWPRAQAFANRAETSPGRALDEIASMASSGDAAGAREAAATLEPVWSGLDRGKPLPPLGNALRAADAVADARAAAMLLKPFKIGNLTEHGAEAPGQIAARYGQDWTGTLLRGWFGEDRPAWDRGTGQAEWAARSLPGIRAGLQERGHGGTAGRLLDLAWEQIRRDTDTGLASSSPSYRDKKLTELGKPFTALLTAAAATGAVSTLAAISDYIQQLAGDPVATLEIAVLRAAADLRAETDPSADPSPGETQFRDLAADCAARLRGQLDRPRREPGDWSITLPAGGCPCDLCATLRDFLAAPDRRMLAWPLAKQRRQHVHARIDTAEIPVTHVTKRQGSPYVLVSELESVAARIAGAAPERAVGLYETFIAACYGKADEVGDSSGYFGTFGGSLFSRWVTARQAASADPADTVARLLTWMANDQYGFWSHVEDDIASALDEAGRAACAGHLERLLGAGTDSAFTRRQPGKLLRAVYIAQRDADACTALAERAGLTAGDCLAMATILAAKDDPTAALTWVERGLRIESSYDLRARQRELLTAIRPA